MVTVILGADWVSIGVGLVGVGVGVAVMGPDGTVRRLVGSTVVAGRVVVWLAKAGAESGIGAEVIIGELEAGEPTAADGKTTLGSDIDSWVSATDIGISPELGSTDE